MSTKKESKRIHTGKNYALDTLNTLATLMRSVSVIVGFAFVGFVFVIGFGLAGIQQTSTEEVGSAIKSTEAYLMTAEVKAYSPWDGGNNQTGITADGTDTSKYAGYWGVAADWRLFPKGTYLRIPGYHPANGVFAGRPWQVDDTGGAIRQRTDDILAGASLPPLIEVRFQTAEEAIEWGSRILQVEVLR